MNLLEKIGGGAMRKAALATGCGNDGGSSATGGRSWYWRASSGPRICGPKTRVRCAAAVLWAGVCETGICVLP